ncbi:MAG: beta-lactamase family protein [Candidatus Eiseniibacteriota bacterium]|nr:MAG: beta-lactamase family protein [Candidatus Eisenbacteria bacterium]
MRLNRARAFLILLPLVAVLSIATGRPAWAQQSRGPYTDVPALPEGVFGERIAELIDVINSNDSSRVRTFVEQRLTESSRNMAPMEEHLATAAELYEQSRGFDFHSIRDYEAPTPAEEFVVIVRNRLTQDWQAFILLIEQEPPHLIKSLQFSSARPPSDLPPAAKLSESQLVRELEAFVQRLADADAFSGTVLLARDGIVLFKGAYGLASKRFNVPNRMDTKFNLGSMNKMFTGVAIAQLVEQGRLSLDDSLSKFLSSEWLPLEITAKIQIKHLLTHTSGLGSYFNDKYNESSRLLFRELDDYKPLIAGDTLAFEPGTDWRYSNTGMFLLGVVIENVTNQSYFDYVREHIYEPAGMSNTDCYDMDRPVPNLAIGYSRERSGPEPRWTNNIFKHVVRGGPAGGGFSTVEDLLKFDSALRSHKLLTPDYTEMVWSGKPELNSPDYGFGFGVRGTPENRIVGHSGGFAGINSNLSMFLDTGYTCAVMSNYDMGAHRVVTKIEELLGRLE